MIHRLSVYRRRLRAQDPDLLTFARAVGVSPAETTHAEGEAVTINVEALRKTMAAVEAAAKRGEWNQKVWRCKTGMCFAGWAAEIHGGRWATSELNSEWADWLIVEDDDPRERVIRIPDGPEVVTARTRAERLLGITPMQANHLFRYSNTLPTLRAAVAALIEQGALGDEAVSDGDS